MPKVSSDGIYGDFEMLQESESFGRGRTSKQYRGGEQNVAGRGFIDQWLCGPSPLPRAGAAHGNEGHHCA